MSAPGRERPASDAEAAESSPPVVADKAVASGQEPSNAAVVDDPFSTFTEWGSPADEADYAGL